MRDPELVARAQHAAARLESAWERWRALQGLGETPTQPVVGYVGYALREPWGQPRAVIGFSAEEAERLAEFLEHSTTDSALEVAQRQVPSQPNQLSQLSQLSQPSQPNQQPAPSSPSSPPPAAGKRTVAGGKQTAASRAAASAASPAVAAPAAPAPPAPSESASASAPVAAAPAANPEALAVTSQLPGSQRRHSFLPGISARLNSTGAVSAAPVTIVWTRDGQAPARVQTFFMPAFQLSWLA